MAKWLDVLAYVVELLVFLKGLADKIEEADAERGAQLKSLLSRGDELVAKSQSEESSDDPVPDSFRL